MVKEMVAMDKCVSCKKREADFGVDGEELCAECTIELAEDRIRDRKNFKVCPYCHKKIDMNHFLFHIATEHRKEHEEAQKRGGSNE
jgi:hypothetical protein